MGRITNSPVLDACAFFLSSSEFQLQGLDVLKQVVFAVISVYVCACM